MDDKIDGYVAYGYEDKVLRIRFFQECSKKILSSRSDFSYFDCIIRVWQDPWGEWEDLWDIVDEDNTLIGTVHLYQFLKNFWRFELDYSDIKILNNSVFKNFATILLI